MKKTVVFFMFFILLFSYRLFSQPQIKFHLSFEDNAIENISKKSGELKGGKYVEGKDGKGIYFDGKEKIEEGVVECIYFNDTATDTFIQNFEDNPFTISVWIKPDSTKSHRAKQEILSTMRADRGPGWRLMFSWRMIYFWAGNGKDYWFVHTNGIVDKVNLDQWNHIVVIRNQEGIISLYLNGKKVADSKEVGELYLDGKKSEEKKEKFEIIPSKIPLIIGAYAKGYAYGFKGVIDEVKIYKGILTEGEILKEYTKKKLM